MPFARALTISVVLGLSLGVFACGGPPSPKSSAAGLPTYDAEDAALLDDGLSGHLFETAFVPGSAGDDAHFSARVLRAESIWLVKVATVSREGSEGALGVRRSYSLTLRPLESIVGELPAEPISLTISGKDPAFHWLDRVQGGWVGHEVVLMARYYRDGERVVLHFHGEPNSAALREKIAEILRAPSTRK